MLLLTVVPVDVPRPPSGGLDPPSGHILPGTGTAQLPAEDSSRRDSPQRMQAPLPRRHLASSQRAYVPTHMRYQSA